MGAAVSTCQCYRPETTHVYIEADIALKEAALGKLNPVDDGPMLRFRADDSLLEFLASL